MFKVGDKVKVVDNDRATCLLSIGEELDVRRVEGGYVYLHGIIGRWNSDRFELALSDEERAIRLLNEKGYTITPPPEPLKGKVFVYKYKDRTYLFDSMMIKEFGIHPHYGEPIAIVPWTEGQGLEKDSPS